MRGPEIHAENTERRKVADLIPYARNSRKHTAESTSALVRGIQEWGWTYPVLIDEDGGVLAGHGRILAAQKMKMEEVPVIVARGWSEEKKRAYIIWDNKSADLSTFDPGVLKMELESLMGDGFDLSLTGFSSLELTGIFSTQEGNTDPDSVPEPPTHPVSQLGDLWRLGEHWLICGDSTDKETVERVLQGQKPHLMVTDPPYGVAYDANWRNEAMRADGTPSDGRAIGKVKNDDRCDWREAWAHFPGDVAYVWHAGRHASEVQQSLEAVGFEIRAQVIWAKSNIAIGRGHYHFQHEPCWYAVRKGATGHWSGDRKQSTLWQIDKPQKSETGHSTQKPVECMARPIRNNSQPGDRIYEPFTGSGTTLIAAQMNKRIAHCVELSPAYVDVCLKRFAEFSGVAPTLPETGETFEQVKARRAEVV